MGTSHFPEAHGPPGRRDPTRADARLARLLPNAYTMTLSGEALRTRPAVVHNDGLTPSPAHPRRRCAPLGAACVRLGEAGFLRLRGQLCTGLGGRNHRNTQDHGWLGLAATVSAAAGPDAVGLALFAQVALIQLWLGNHEGGQI
jgi:hypothetical protein